MSNQIQGLIFHVLYAFKLIIGTLVFNANIFIFTIFATKKEKLPSDFLILPNLMIDALHGLAMCIPFYLIDSNFMLKGQLCFQIFIFFSLVMLILMTLNRYVAAMRPMKYRLWFNKSSILLSFLAITVITVALFSAVAYALFVAKVVDTSIEQYCETYYERACAGYSWWEIEKNLPYCLTEYKKHEKCYEREKSTERALINVNYFVFYLWPQFQLLLVICNTLFMCFVYKTISSQFEKGRSNTHFCKFFVTLIKIFRNDDITNRKTTTPSKDTLTTFQETNFSENGQTISEHRGMLQIEIKQSTNLIGGRLYIASIMTSCLEKKFILITLNIFFQKSKSLTL